MVPHSHPTWDLGRLLSGTHVTVVAATGSKISNIVSKKIKDPRNENSVVYKIPCGECDNKSRGLSVLQG